MPSTKKLLQAAAGNAGGDPLYVEDVFSTYLYAGNGNVAFDITNNIDLAGEGGLVWIKVRNASYDHNVFDTERGANEWLETNTTLGEQTATNKVDAFNADGFSLGTNTLVNGGTDKDYASWTFRKAEKFFDVLTYTGDGNANHEISHNLGSVPGCIIIKNASGAWNWLVYHKDSTNDLNLNTTSQGFFSLVDSVTSTSFNFSSFSSLVNASGSTYVAYLFASDAGGFGDDGDESIIKCGTYTGTGGGGTPPVIDLGFEPQWLLVKQASAASGGNWMLMDTMRGWGADGSNLGPKNLRPNTSDAEFNWGQYNYDLWTVNPTGFTVGPTDLYNVNNESGATFIYIAIRRPMKTPESGTEVFTAVSGTATNPAYVANHTVDMTILKQTGGSNTSAQSRLQGSGRSMNMNATIAEYAFSGIAFDYQTGAHDSGVSSFFSWMFKRATGFMDVVAYSGDGTASRQITHNLGSAPEMIIVKCRSASNTYWETWHEALPDDGAWASNVALNSTDGYGGFQRFDGAATQTAAYWTTGNNGEPNTSGQTYISYLFATLAGVSKVGSYTGTGSNVDVDCGFSAGARFILIKRSDSTGDWYVWDSARGIVAGNDPYLLLNSTAAEVTNTDYIDPLSSGFTVTSSAPAALNASGGTYIFLAIA